ncbi:MAG: DUF2076 family protein [Acidobacteriaceae bacterium]|nr:DUF2076 family protein [Acidobacteriaceae bacterium]
MTPDERKMLEDLADKFGQTPTPPKDAEAEDFIRKRIGSRPDALYLMTQTVLIQNLALQQAQQQLRDLQQRASQPATVGGSGSFLGGQQGAPRGASGYSGQQQYAAPPPQYAPAPPPQYAPAPPQYTPSPGSGAPSFLRGAAQTAAGVAAGALAFEGIQALFSHPGYGGGGGFFGGGGGFGGGAPVEETVVNNYYDQPQQDDYRNDDRGGYDAQDSGDSGNYDDSANYDHSGNYDSGDGGGFDDGGGGGDNFV